MPEFIPGLKLCEAFYWEAVRPILDEAFPGLAHAAALIGYGSDVLGYDTPVSRDHGWGPRLVLLLPEEGFEANRAAVNETLRQRLPVRFMGYSTHFGLPDPTDNGVRPTREIEHGPVDHLISMDTISGFWRNELGADPYADPSPVDWLTFQEQGLLSVTAGKVYHDGLGLEAVRRRFSYYPHDVWLYLLAAQWMMISQEEAFIGRAASVGDELGSRILTSRMAERLMRLCFLYERRYPPYSKWFGVAFKDLACYPRMQPLLAGALAAEAYPQRERFIAQAYTLAVELLNGLNVIPALDPATHTYSNWHNMRVGILDVADDDPSLTRPHQIIFAGRIADPLYAAIRDPRVLELFPHLGSVSQFMTPSCDALQNVAFIRRLADDMRK